MRNNIDTDAYLSELHDNYYEGHQPVEPKDPDIGVEELRAEEFDND